MVYRRNPLQLPHQQSCGCDCHRTTHKTEGFFASWGGCCDPCSFFHIEVLQGHKVYTASNDERARWECDCGEVEPVWWTEKDRVDTAARNGYWHASPERLRAEALKEAAKVSDDEMTETLRSIAEAARREQ